MATGGEKQICYSLAKVGTITLENTNEISNSNSIVICQNKIIVVDRIHKKVRIHRLHDGKFLDRLDSDSRTRGICLTDATTMCVLHEDGLVEMASIRSDDLSPVFTRIRSFSLHGVFDRCYRVVRVNDNIVVTGRKHDTLYWCIVSLDDGHVDSIHQICKRSEFGHSHVTTKDNRVYISCYAGVKSPNTGVYGFDILNPSQCKYIYKHQRLQWPTAIVINEDGNIFVGNNGFHNDACIHQLTASCQLVAIFTPGITPRLNAMFWDNGRLYVTRYGSHDITVFRHVYQGSYKTSEVLGSHELKQPGIDELAIQIAKINLIEQIVEENLNQAGIKMSTDERDLFIKFQNEIGTDIYFSKGPHRLIDGQETLKATETFFQQNRPDMMEKWLEYKRQGKLTPELIDVIYAKERNPDLHANKDEFLKHMENLNIIVKARSFDENGVKEENYFFTACILRPESEREDIAAVQDPLMLSTTLCWDFSGTNVPYSIFDEVLSACIARWPVAKKKDTSEHLISHGYAVFDLDCVHRLALTFENHVVLAEITWLVVDNIKTPDAKLCTMVRMFISRKLSKITNSLNQSIQYELCLQRPDSRFRFAPFQMWFEDEIHDPDSPIKREHMNHTRLYIALVTVCGKALREMLLDNFPVPCLDIYQAILANHAKLTGERGKPLLDKEQIKLVFSDPLGQKTGTVDMFDLSLLYKLIRNVSRVQPPIHGWGKDPKLWETSLGASVERIRKYRNDIGGHSPDAKIEDTKFNYYWKEFEGVIHDIETAINKKVYSKELDRQKRQVISVFDAC